MGLFSPSLVNRMRYLAFGFLPIWWIKNSMRAEFGFAFLFWVRLSIFSRAQELSVFHFLWIIRFAYLSVGLGKLFIWGILTTLPHDLSCELKVFHPIDYCSYFAFFFFHPKILNFYSQIFNLFFYSLWILIHRKIHPRIKWERLFSTSPMSTSMLPF